MAVISVENLTHTYSAGTPFEQTAIRDVSVTLTQGEKTLRFPKEQVAQVRLYVSFS